jgi:hypothetical protein
MTFSVSVSPSPTTYRINISEEPRYSKKSILIKGFEKELEKNK